MFFSYEEKDEKRKIVGCFEQDSADQESSVQIERWNVGEERIIPLSKEFDINLDTYQSIDDPLRFEYFPSPDYIAEMAEDDTELIKAFKRMIGLKIKKQNVYYDLKNTRKIRKHDVAACRILNETVSQLTLRIYTTDGYYTDIMSGFIAQMQDTDFLDRFLSFEEYE